LLVNDPAVEGKQKVLAETRHTTDKDGKYSFTIPPEQVAKYYLYI
jgi:hypothetical protein